MTELKKKKRFFAHHAKSSAMVVSLAIHAILILVAVSFVAVTVIKKEDQRFEGKQVVRPKQALKKLQVPVKMNKQKPKPKLRKRLVAKQVNRKVPEFKMPEVSGIKGGTAGVGDMGGGSLGFTMPEINFFGTKAKGEKVVFVVHFGPATIQQGRDLKNKNQPREEYNNPFTRMTDLTIRNRLEELINGLPEYTLFNVIAYYASDADALNPTIMLATPANKKKVMDWMATVNPLEGDYDHCFTWGDATGRINAAKKSWPTRVDNLPFYSLKWAYPYVVPKEIEKKYAPDAPNGFMHWGRGVVWAILEQKPDTIFVLTTNYIDGWSQRGNDDEERTPNEPVKMAKSLRNMIVDIYGTDRKRWPTINVVVLAPAGKDASGAGDVLNSQFGPIWKGFNGEGSVIDDIKKYMTDDERDLMTKYKSKYGAKD
ncbi:MAG: hypothetical protein K9M54_01045 [Kiritimatiellales bacterium]|nr:hypothetical protein [Kiritimatiellales bacterium]